MQDGLTTCKHCGSAMAYETIEDGKFYEVSCIGCGFMTNSYMLEGTEELKAYLETLPDLYADLKFIDEDGLCWVPMYKEVYGRGAVSVNGIDKDNWLWAYFPFVPLTETDPEKDVFRKPDGTYPEYKPDFKNQQHFTKNQFLLALQLLGYFEQVTPDNLQNLA